MTHDRSQRAQTPLEPEPGVLVHPTADRRLATEHWLLSATPNPSRARMEWQEHGVAMLPLGGLFSAVRIPGPLIHAVAASTKPADVDTFLDEAIEGPIICDPRHNRYYALVPATMPTTWHQAADDWRPADVECLGRGTYLGVPRLDAVEHNPYASYWSVPMPSMAILCAPLTVARLIAEGRHLLPELPDAPAALVTGPRRRSGR